MRTFLIIAVSVVLLTCGLAPAAEVYWDDEGGDGLWNTAANWNVSPPGGVNAVPGPADNANMDYGPGANITVDGAAVCLTATVSHWYQGMVLNVPAGASMDVRNNFVLSGSNVGGGTLINEGLITDTVDGYVMEFIVGAYNTANLTMNGGLIETTYMEVPGWWANSTSAPNMTTPSHLQMNAGTVDTWQFKLVGHDGTKNGTCDMLPGALIRVRQAGAIPELLSFVANGWLTGNGNANDIVIELDPQGTDTLIYAVPEPMTLSLLAMGGLALIRRRK